MTAEFGPVQYYQSQWNTARMVSGDGSDGGDGGDGDDGVDGGAGGH